ncbi:MAG: HDOD domain-containing protein [Rubrivivax sp.]|nr:HDOD domain-containing protein [Rubrivivax sp.]
MSPPGRPEGEYRSAQHEGTPMSLALDASVVARRVRDLPALPAALTHVLAAMRREDMRSDRFAELIEHDQALCGRTLRLANSAFYGLPGRVGSIDDALRLLGLRTVANVVTAASLAAYATHTSCTGFDFAVFWRHSIGVSIAARAIGQARGFDDGQACVAGLLHDAGQLALATYFPQAMSAALALSRTSDCELLDAERALLGLDHAEVGGMVARHWCLPEEMVDAIRRHHRPPLPAQAGATTWLVDTVHLADAMVHALDLSRSPDESVPAVSLDSWERLDAGSLDSAQIFAAVETGVQAMCAALDT